MSRRGQQDHGAIACDVVDPVKPLEEWVVGRLERYLSPLRGGDFDMLAQDPLVFRVRLGQDRPFPVAHQQVGLRDLRDPPDMIEMQMRDDRRSNIAGSNACVSQNVVDAIGLGHVKPKDPRQQKAPDRLFDIAPVGHDRRVDPGIEQHQSVTMIDQEALQGQRHPASPKEDPPKLRQPAAVAVFLVLLCAPAVQDPNRRNLKIGNVVFARFRCLSFGHR